MVRLQGVLFITLERERENIHVHDGLLTGCTLISNIRVGTFEVYNELCMNLVGQSKSSIN